MDRIAPAGSVDDNGIVTFEVRITVQDPEGLLKPDMNKTEAAYRRTDHFERRESVRNQIAART